MRTQKDKTEYIHIRISKDIKEKYLKLCDNNGYSISKRIRLFIEKELGDEKKD